MIISVINRGGIFLLRPNPKLRLDTLPKLLPNTEASVDAEASVIYRSSGILAESCENKFQIIDMLYYFWSKNTLIFGQILGYLPKPRWFLPKFQYLPNLGNFCRSGFGRSFCRIVRPKLWQKHASVDHWIMLISKIAKNDLFLLYSSSKEAIS